MKDQPAPEQIAAVEAFRARVEYRWKSELGRCWSSGVYPAGVNSALLQQVRNQFGPVWLMNYRSKG